MALLGSGHCFGMCGGIAAFVGVKRTFTYQLGRLIGYVAVGGISGSMGQGLFRVLEKYPEVMVFLSVGFSILLFLQALAWWRGSPDRSAIAHSNGALFKKLFSRVSALISKRGGSFSIGLGTALLPCGWIAAFGLVAAGTDSSWNGMLVFALLWLGSLPALLAASMGMGALRGRMRSKTLQRITAVVMAAVAFFSFTHRLSPHLGDRERTEQAVCHSMQGPSQ